MGQLRLVPKPQTKSDFWQHHLRQQHASKLSAAGYCRRHQLTYATFLYWRDKIAPHMATEDSPAAAPVVSPVPRFAALPSSALERASRPRSKPRALDPQKASGIHLSLGPFRLQLSADFDAEALQRLLPLLEEAVSC